MKPSYNLNLIISLIILLFFAGCKKNNDSAGGVTSGLPKVDFAFTISNSKFIPDTITFTNLTTNGQTYKWTLWDGTTISVTGPISIYYPVTSYPTVPLTVTLTATNGNGTVSITKQITFSGPALTGVTSTFPNTVATISGANFSAGIANNQLTLNGVAVTILSATTTSITFMVPANAVSGSLVLTTNGGSITTRFTVFSLSVAPFTTQPPYHLKHIAYIIQGQSTYPGDFSANTYGVNETDSLYNLNHYRSGGAGQYSGTSGFYSAVLPASVKLMGVSGLYLAASDFHIYQIGYNPLTMTNYPVIAGNGISGYADGAGTSAQFVSPFGIANDEAGNAYITDAHRVRKMTPAGVVTTLAGNGADGHADGQGAAATFGNLWGITVDAVGNVYVTDVEYHNIRKITPTGVVTTLAGSGVAGLADGNGTAAQFCYPKGIAVDAAGNLFVSDVNYTTALPYVSAIRMIDAAGMVSTILSSANGDPIIYPDGIAVVGNSLLICSTGSATRPLVEVDFVAK